MDFASAALVQLAVRELSRHDPALLPPGMAAPDSAKTAHASIAAKRALLAHALAAGGPPVLLAVGQGTKRAGFNPVLHVLLNSAGPRILADKWTRLERFGHSRNRTRIAPAGENGFTLDRYARGGGSPSHGENYLICGLLIALLEAIGCRGLACDFIEAGRGRVAFYRDGRCLDSVRWPRRTDRWSIGWVDFRPSARAMASGEARRLPAFAVATPTAHAAARLLATDLGRRWRLAELATALGRSGRSLQRELGAAGLSFSDLVRNLRLHEACCLLEARRLSLTEIGHCCGFSDSAHFSREFRRVAGMSPSQYREAAG